ncbi:MAG: hypothetical protein ACRDYA_09935 [Egibacteraceae bacterium]
MISAFWRIVRKAADRADAEFVLLDVGPNLGPTLRRWRQEWQQRQERNPKPEELPLPPGTMQPAGYVVLQHGIRLDRPVHAYDRWIRRIPVVYREAVLGVPASDERSIRDDPYCIALIKHYHSLAPMAQEARKPIFLLKPADGAIGAHQSAVHRAFADFADLAHAIEARVASQSP